MVYEYNYPFSINMKNNRNKSALTHMIIQLKYDYDLKNSWKNLRLLLIHCNTERHARYGWQIRDQTSSYVVSKDRMGEPEWYCENLRHHFTTVPNVFQVTTRVQGNTDQARMIRLRRWSWHCRPTDLRAGEKV